MKYSFIGPTFGSFLDILGGYPLPFYTVGSIIMILSICSTIFMPNKNIEVKSKAAFNNNQLKVWTVFMVKKLDAQHLGPSNYTLQFFRPQQCSGH